MAARVLAQILVAGGTVIFRAAAQAWGQALVNAQRSGVAQEAAQGAAKAVKKGMTAAEAQMILGVKPDAPWGEVVSRYKHMFEVNEKHGSFYLQSKVYRAHEALETEYKEDGRYTPEEDKPATGPQAQVPPSDNSQQQQQQGPGHRQ
mmetsp:Transcript_19663/g.58326  ORF Transcript_19663/g.58326 Transcript_19663/m.58326 type:complete len:147 (-) Transcript_19663:363-803(-)